uniref:Uncharacterized protein n=1 Tax=Cacopsylla melanoneura TaxID=428564 RepID=A0A8D8S649_9HEMI
MPCSLSCVWVSDISSRSIGTSKLPIDSCTEGLLLESAISSLRMKKSDGSIFSNSSSPGRLTSSPKLNPFNTPLFCLTAGNTTVLTPGFNNGNTVGVLPLWARTTLIVGVAPV